MKKVTGVGGVFFKCKDPKAINEWYKTHLGFDTTPYGTSFEWQQNNLESGEIKKGYDLFTSVTEQTKKIYQEFLDEQPGTIQVKGRGKQLINRNVGGKSKELE